MTKLLTGLAFTAVGVVFTAPATYALTATQSAAMAAKQNKIRSDATARAVEQTKLNASARARAEADTRAQARAGLELKLRALAEERARARGGALGVRLSRPETGNISSRLPGVAPGKPSHPDQQAIRAGAAGGRAPTADSAHRGR